MPQYNNRQSSNKGLMITLFFVSFFAVAALGFLFYNVFTSSPTKNSTTSTSNTNDNSQSSATTTVKPTTKPGSSNSLTPTPNNGDTNTISGDIKVGDAGQISYLSNWEVVTSVPDAVKADISSNPNPDSKMFVGNCTLMLKNKNSNSMMVVDTKPQDGNGSFCFSSGMSFQDTNRKILTTNFNRTLTVAKWAIDKTIWKNDYLEGPLTLINTGKKEYVEFALYTTEGNKYYDEKDFDTMLDTWQYR